MEKWLRERIIHRYIIENYRKYKHNGLSIVKVIDNKDQFPDLFCELENAQVVPVEIEWKSSNFVQHGHDINYMKENGGFLFVCEKDQDLGFDIAQYEIQLSDFENWFADNSRQIARDTINDYKKEAYERRKIPKLFISYLSLKADGTKHFEVALQYSTWGIQEKYSGAAINQITSVQEGDLIAFIGAGRGFLGRIDLEKWSKRTFKGYFERLRLYRVTKGYFFDKTPIWNGVGKWKEETFPHRFCFNPNPILDLADIKINKLSLLSKADLHRMVYGNFVAGTPSTLVDMVFHARLVEMKAYKSSRSRLQPRQVKLFEANYEVQTKQRPVS